MPLRSHACGSAPGTEETETREVLNIGTRVQMGFLDASPRQGSLGQCSEEKFSLTAPGRGSWASSLVSHKPARGGYWRGS